ncbi:MAG TPA: hypothetical protein VNG53_09740, partial [Bacteroidia bacterium]|nr:hypothetical protein [Bacteroidia bacterium]
MEKSYRKIFFSIAIISILCCIPYKQGHSQCSVKHIVKNYKANIKPFKYDSYAMNDIIFTGNPQQVEVEFTAFAGQKYKLVFATSGFEEMVTVNIYDHNSRSKKRKKLYDNDSGIDNLFWSFEPKKSGTYYIDYDIPPAGAGQAQQGCIVMLIGYIVPDKDN